jgi:hypothetical protein
MRYVWNDAKSPIKDIEIYAPHKMPEALIYAPKNMPQEKLWKITDALKHHGLSAEPDTVGEEGVLRVKHFKASSNLIKILQTENFVEGPLLTHKTMFDAKEKSELRPQQKTGLLYMAGDTALMATGAMRNGWLNGKSLWQAISSGPGKKDIASGMKWFAAGLLLFFFGAKNPDKQTQYAYADLLTTLDKNNVPISADDRATLRILGQHSSGILSHAERIVRDKPLVINSALQAMGGFDAATAGIQQKRPVTGKPNYIKSASGMSTFLGHSTSLLTKEKTDEEKKDNAEREKDPNRTLLERFNDWRRERKYRIAGSASVVSSLLRLIGGYQEVKVNGEFLASPNAASHADYTTISRARHAAKIEWGVNSVKAVANWYYALAGQSVNTDVKKLGILDEICNTVAHLAASRAKGEERNIFVANIATILAEQGNLENSVQEITEAVDKKIAAMAKNPWEKPPAAMPASSAAPSPTMVAQSAVTRVAGNPLPSIIGDGRSTPERLHAGHNEVLHAHT